LKAVIQRVTDAQVTVDGFIKGRIKTGLLVYLGVAQDDGEADADWLCKKVVNLRIFNDNNGVMNLSLGETSPDAGILVVSQFTLLADARKGRRPSWSGAASPEKAKSLYEYFLAKIRGHGLLCENGEFQAHMKVSYTNDGPVTILLDTKLVNLQNE